MSHRRRGGKAKGRYESSFDQGSAASIDATNPFSVRIAPQKTFSGKWAWFSLKHRALGGKTPSFKIAKANHYGMVVDEWLACWSQAADTDTWTLLDNPVIGATDFTFNKATSFPSGTIYIAHLPMYPFSRTERKMAEWAATGLISETPSTEDYILGYATARPNGDGRTAPALPFYGFKVANVTANTKNKAIFASGVHPSENIGRFLFEGAIDWLTTPGPHQKMFLDWFDSFCYPALNPQGIYGGYFRSSPETPDSDNNRLWDGTGVNEAVDAFKTAFTADTDDEIEVGLDFHSWLAADGYRAITADSTGALWVAFIAAMVVQDATFTKRVDDDTVSMLANYWANLATPAKLSGAIDHGSIAILGPTQWKLAGKNTMLALVKLLASGYFTNGPGVGSRLFNGTTDRISWSPIVNPIGHACSVSFMVYMTANPTNGYILCIHDAGDLSYGFVINNIATSRLNVIRKGTTDYMYYTSNNVLPVDGWLSLVITDNGLLAADSVTVKINKVAKTVGFTNGSGAETSHAGSLSIGGRIYSDTRNLPARVAQLRYFDRVLTEAEQLLEGDMIYSTVAGLKFWFKGNTDDLHDAVTDTEGVAVGTTQLTGAGNGPAVIYP
jgi:hypothetical protein